MKLSVVVPTVNSAPFIERSVRHFDEYLAAAEFVDDYEIIVAAQTSRDGTFAVVRRLAAADPRVTALCLPEVGKGHGVTEGIKAAAFDWVLMVDCDLSYPIEYLAEASRLLADADIIIGSRYLERPQVPLGRRWASRGYIRLVRLLFGLPQRDVQAGLKLMRKSIFRAAGYPRARGFVWDTELLYNARQAGLRVAEVPVAYDFVENTIRLRRAAPRMLRDLLALWWRKRVRRV